jgi:hypothetical protein
VPRPAKTLLEASDRYPYGRREDRLTEVFASALEALPELARRFIEATGAPPPSANETPGVTTQGMFGGSGRPDLVLDYADEAGNPRRILSEHKIDAELTAFQRLSYADWRPDAVVLVAPDAQAYRAAGGFDAYITWQRVAEEIDRLGSDRAHPRWRHVALDPESPGRLRCLEVLLSFLERQNVGVSSMSPMDEESVRAYGALRTTRSKFEMFIEMVRESPRLRELGASLLLPEEQKTQWWISLDAPVWPYLRSLDPAAGAHIALEPSPDWLGHDDQPVVYAGFYFSTPDGRLPSAFAARHSSLSEQLREASAEVGLRDNRKQGKCAALLYLSEVALRGGTLRDQAEYVAGWAADALVGISRISV